MLVTSLILLLFLSFALHINTVIQYVIKKEKKYIKYFLNTAILNIIAAFSIIFVAIKNPEAVRAVNMKYLLWAISGLLLVLTLSLKISIFKRVYARAQQPEHYHLNFFGKKVLHPTVITKFEFTLFLASVPFFLLAGAYFVARMINMILYGHL
jgi:hypothetical protein